MRSKAVIYKIIFNVGKTETFITRLRTRLYTGRYKCAGMVIAAVEQKGRIMMKGWKTIGILCAAGMLLVLAACSGNETEQGATPTMTPEVTESALPSPEVSPSPSAGNVPQQNGQQGNAGGQGSQTQGEKMTAVFIGRADQATIEIMADEQVKTARLSAQMQEKFAALELQDNQKIEITYETKDGQIVVQDIKK